MKKQTDKPVLQDGETLVPHELKSTELSDKEKENKQSNVSNSLDDDFENFKKEKSKFQPEQLASKNHDIAKPIIQQTQDQLKAAYNFKARMLLGFCTAILAGFNTYLFNFMRGSNVPVTEMLLTETEKAGLMPYMDAPEIMAFINSLSPLWIGIMHIEYMFFMKHSIISAKYKVITETETETNKK